MLGEDFENLSKNTHIIHQIDILTLFSTFYFIPFAGGGGDSGQALGTMQSSKETMVKDTVLSFHWANNLARKRSN